MGEKRSMTLWTSGLRVIIDDFPDSPHMKVNLTGDWDGLFVTPTEDIRHKVRIQYLADMYDENEILCNESSLVEECMGKINGFEYDEVTNLYPNPSKLSLKELHDTLKDIGAKMPKINPWSMTTVSEICFALGTDPDTDEPIEKLRDTLIKEIEAENVPGLKEFRNLVSSEANPVEILEWWRVTGWLSEKLNNIGEPVLSNEFGEWWGRCTSGQSRIMDGVLQRVAAHVLYRETAE